MMNIAEFQQLINPFLYPVLIVMLLGTGLFLTIRLGFIQFRRLGHGIRVAMGHYDDPDDPGDVSHFQALTTALSATVGIGNIAGVAIAIHFRGARSHILDVGNGLGRHGDQVLGGYSGPSSFGK